MYASVDVYTGVSFYKVPETHGHVNCSPYIYPSISNTIIIYFFIDFNYETISSTSINPINEILV